jgi:magnesium chelatase subunit I
VSLFNILQEGDIQIRGFKTRLPLDIQFVFTANPEDYTNRGSIVTPLKDRIESQIMTHYPRTVEISRTITEQESQILPEQEIITIPDFMRNLVEFVAVEARESDLVDKKSGVSARLTIAALECLYSSVERRMLLAFAKQPYARVLDMYGALPAITGKVELVYEGEVEGMGNVAQNFIGKAIRRLFTTLFPSPENKKRQKGQKQEKNEYAPIINWFNEGNFIELTDFTTDNQYEMSITQVSGLEQIVRKHYNHANKQEQLVLMEFVLHGLAAYSQISLVKTDGQVQFKDIMGSMMNLNLEEPEEGYYDDEA